MTREVARRLIFFLFRASSATVAVVVGGLVVPACYSGGGGGTDPPTGSFYFPVGLVVSSGGNALYAVNSDFDLQWNGGTLQSYDLFQIRADTAALINANLRGQAQSTLEQGTAANIPFIFTAATTPCPIGVSTLQSDAGAPILNNSAGSRIPLGEACAPPVDTTKYVRSSVVIGAFASDLQLQTTSTVTKAGNIVPVVGHRLFSPVRGDATLTWADVEGDNPASVPAAKSSSGTASSVPAGGALPDPGAAPGAQTLGTGADIFTLQCGAPSSGTPTCDSRHRTGDNGSQAGDTRDVTLPGEPFGMAQTPDGTAIAITHQTTTQTSLLLAGTPDSPPVDPSMQFVVTDVANAGKGITSVPHDKDAPTPPCELVSTSATTILPSCVRPAFLETSGSSAELDLLRYYTDDNSSLTRPYLTKETIFPFSTNLAGTDSRGIAIDATPRMQCKLNGLWPVETCAEIPARIFFASRSPPTLVLASIGGTPSIVGGTYDPDLVTFGTSSLPLPAGPSRVYVAPIANLEHKYELRVFVVNFDSSTISVYNPANGPDLALIDTIYVGPGPFAMAFDPFSIEDVAAGNAVPSDDRYDPSLNLTMRYRFAYVASFTQSYVQVIDLDESQPTFESVVFTLGNPTPPKGS